MKASHHPITFFTPPPLSLLASPVVTYIHRPSVTKRPGRPLRRLINEGRAGPVGFSGRPAGLSWETLVINNITKKSWQNRHGELSQQRRQQPRSGQRQSIFNVELTPERDSHHLGTTGGRRAFQQKRTHKEPRNCVDSRKVFAEEDDNKTANQSTATAVISKWTLENDL